MSCRLYSASANRVYKRKRKPALTWDWIFIRTLGWRALKTPTAETPGFYGHVTPLTLHYLWPRPPGVWLGGLGCKPGHSRWPWWSPTIKIASGLIPVMICLWYHAQHYRRSNIIDKPISMTTIVISSPQQKERTHSTALPSICRSHFCGFLIFPDK